MKDHTKKFPKAIILDMDDTILDTGRDMVGLWRSICKRFALKLENISQETLLNSTLESMKWFWRESGRGEWGRLHPAGAMREIVRDTFKRLNVKDFSLVEEIADTFFKERQKLIRPFPGAIKALQQFRDLGIQLAMITNGNAKLQRPKIERFGLNQYFEYILVESEFGSGKPDEQVYLHVIERLKVEPEDAWMVGDNLEWDVKGPQQVGIYGIWLNVTGSGLPKDNDINPDKTIESLSELADELMAAATPSASNVLI